MALVARVRISYEDAKGKSSASKITIPISVSIAAWIGFALQAGQIMLNISTCRITKIGVYSGIDLSSVAIKANPSLVSDVQEKGFFFFFTADGLGQRMLVPAFNENFVIDNTDYVDPAAAPVAAFITAMEDGFIAPPIAPSNVRASDITAFDDAYEAFRKRKGKR